MSETYMPRAIEWSEAEVTVIDPAAGPSRAVAPLTPMAMIDRALASGAGVETLEKLMALQERYEANQAKKAFVAAMAKARAEFKPLTKRHSGYADRYKYESLDDVSEAVDEAYGRHGFSYDWLIEEPGEGAVKVTCTLTHEGGHSKSVGLSGDPKGAADPKANMNAFQRMATAVAYLQRITLKSVSGIAAGKDDDAQSLSESPDFDTSPWTERIIAATHDGALNAIAADLKAAKDIPPEAMRALRAAWAGRKKQLVAGEGGTDASKDA